MDIKITKIKNMDHREDSYLTPWEL